MEHYNSTHYNNLMWMKSKNILTGTKFPWSSVNLFTCSVPSTAVFEGLAWPPRSYTCSFCRREFRSAQALGGHMNVHRRDRARLKQSSPPQQTQPAPENSIKQPTLQVPQQGISEEILGFKSSSTNYDFMGTKLLIDDGTVNCKRHKQSDRCISTSGSSMEDIDLELRLGADPSNYGKYGTSIIR